MAEAPTKSRRPPPPFDLASQIIPGRSSGSRLNLILKLNKTKKSIYKTAPRDQDFPGNPAKVNLPCRNVVCYIFNSEPSINGSVSSHFKANSKISIAFPFDISILSGVKRACYSSSAFAGFGNEQVSDDQLTHMVWYILFIIFVTYAMLPLPLAWSLVAANTTALTQLIYFIVLHNSNINHSPWDVSIRRVSVLVLTEPAQRWRWTPGGSLLN